MGSQRPKVIRLSESSPPANYEALGAELDGEKPTEKKPQRLSLVGSVKEKSFSSDPIPSHRISVPRPRVTPFPIARHRSDGPHWGPLSSKENSDPVTEFEEDGEGGKMAAVDVAVPLSKRRPGQSGVSKWRSTRKSELAVSSQIQNAFDDRREQGEAQEVSGTTVEVEGVVGQQIQGPNGLNSVVQEKDSTANQSYRGQSSYGASHKSGFEDVRDEVQSLAIADEQARQVHYGPSHSLQKHTRESSEMQLSPMSVDKGHDSGGPDSKAAQQPSQSVLNVLNDREIDAESSKALFAMSAQEVAEAQAELSQRIRPEVLERLRKRGAEKERKRHAEKTGTNFAVKVSDGNGRPVGFPGDKRDATEQFTSSPIESVTSVGSIQRGVKTMTLSDDQTVSKRAETVRGTKVGPADLLTADSAFVQAETPSSSNEAPEESTPPPPTTDPWTLRVEAVRSMRFDLNGNSISMAPLAQSNEAVKSNSAAGAQSISPQYFVSVVERDYLRTEGDPVGAGYSLKETLALVRSTVPGQRAVALHLIASVLEKATQGLQDEKLTSSGALDGEGITEQVDWQAVWAYALGPEAEVVLTLRLALDNAHSTVVAACARAIQALLSYSANESYFDSLETLWPGDKAVFTAPVFRRKTKHDEGFIGGGRWKYNVKASEMFPFSETATQEKSEEGGKDTVGDDSHVSNRDVAAGLIRMGILPRIRYLLEVDQLIAAEEALLSILLCFARHSPTAANAVMACPRLIDAILQRFVGTDEHVSEESWSSRVKSIRLLKVLSQAKRTNCVHFESIGALQTLMRPLLRQEYVRNNSEHASDRNQGYYEIMIETLRFWRVCIDYGVGILLFSDCYSTLCFWLLPLSKTEILSGVRDENLLLEKESYLLLEHIARTLPLLHASDERMNLEHHVNWSWGVAQAMLDPATNWLSSECISGVHMLLQQCILAHEGPSQGRLEVKSGTKNILGIVAAVLHFVATVCERIVSEKQLHCALEDRENFAPPWLPTFLPQLGLALARSGLLNYLEADLQLCTAQEGSSVSAVQADSSISTMESDSGGPPLVSRTFTFVECLNFCVTWADHDSALASINCLNAIVRVCSVVDNLIYIAKPRATAPLEDQTLAHKVLEHGLLLSAETELKSVLSLCKENVVVRIDLLQMSVRGGPAPGVGIGWGSSCGGAWSKEVLMAQSSARLALDLLSMFSSRVCRTFSDDVGDAMTEESEPSHQWGLSSRVNFCMSVMGTSTAGNTEIVRRASAGIIFHPSTLSILLQSIKEVLVNWRGKRALEEGFQVENHDEDNKNLDEEHLSKILQKHLESFWLARKKGKGKRDLSHEGLSKKKRNGLGPNLATVEEEYGADGTAHPESLMTEWVGQRLPLPPHWFLSPMVGDSLPVTKKEDELGAYFVSRETMPLEEIIKGGLEFFLGVEVLAASNRTDAEFTNVKIPLVRKIHSLSTVFVSGSEAFLDPTVRDLIGALQNILGDQIGEQSTNSAQLRKATEDSQNVSNRHNAVQDVATPGDLTNGQSSMTEEPGLLDFERSIDASYRNYAELLAEQFVGISYGDHVFGRQVAFHLCLEVPVIIRLATWRVLTDGRVLELLPPLSQCAGPPQKYLYPVEANQEMREAFLSAWSSGALDKAAKRNSLSFTLALHHLAGYVFDTPDTEETLLLKTKTARALVRSTIRKVARQEMLLRLVCYVPVWSSSSDEQPREQSEIISTEKLQSRVSVLSKACEGEGSLTAEVQKLLKLAVSRGAP